MKILVKAVAGSHLFGTNTETSDKDFKGIFLPEANDILLGKFDQTIHQHTNNQVGQKNTKDDVDIEFYSLDKFLKMLYQGQTVAWELLFTPDEMILEAHPLWKEIQAATPLFLNKRVDSFIGYCKQQAHKYGIRGSRMNTLETVLEILKTYMYVDMKDCGNGYIQTSWKSKSTLGDILFDDYDKIIKLEHTERILDKNGKDLVNICGRKFGLDTNLQYVIQPLQKYYDEYGLRSRLAKENSGIDWKALSHAVRVCMQAISLLSQDKIELPMNHRDVKLLKEIKAGELSFERVADIIESYQDLMQDAVLMSKLPEEPNLQAFQDVQKRIYAMIIKGEV